MSATDPVSPHRFRLLATFIAGRSVDVAEADAGQPAYTNGDVIFVSVGGSADEQRREMLLQSALLGAGSLDQRFVKSLRARPSIARRYLAVEGRRVLAELSSRIPSAVELLEEQPCTTTADESLDMARSRTKVVDPPPWFGVIRPPRLLAAKASLGAAAGAHTPSLDGDLDDAAEPDDDDEQSGESKIVKLFESPIASSRSLTDYLRKLFGTSRAPGDGDAGGDLGVGSVRRLEAADSDARPPPTRLHFRNSHQRDALIGIRGALYPEWDVHADRYRAEWCRVVSFPLMTPADVAAGAVLPRDDVLLRRLARIGLEPRAQRGRPDGDELDIDATVDHFVDLRSGHSPPEKVYVERRNLQRNLGVLVLLDASGSATDADPDGLTVHEHQCRAAATLAAALEELGDRVAVYAFRSHGRHTVQLPAIKTFGQRFGAVERVRLRQLQPAGYTRLGAAIRGAGEILGSEAGTPHRLLVVISDGFAYDDGYEGRYAEADTARALDELGGDGIACLCLSIGGAATETASPQRAFGTASHASAPTLADLSPRMDELFLSSLRELSAPRARSDVRR